MLFSSYSTKAGIFLYFCIPVAGLYSFIAIKIYFRFTGALCGLTYVYALPPIIYMIQKKDEGKLTRTSVVLHCAIIGVGILNFIGQVIISA